MGWRTGKFIRVSLRQECRIAVARDDVGDLPCATIQSASDLCRLTLRDRVRVDGGGHGQYLQEIPVRGLPDSREFPAGNEFADVERANKEKTMPINPIRLSNRVTG